MFCLRSSCRSWRFPLGLGVGIAFLATAGCGEAEKPAVKPGDSSTTYNVPAPPTDVHGKGKSGQGKKGTMSARELRDFRNKETKAQP
jgi:hypothetical protein